MAKRDLSFDLPMMNAAGMLGFFPDLRGRVEWAHFGSFVTNPISLTARTPARGERYIAFPGGFMLHTGYPNPGLTHVLRRYVRRWNRSPLPVIVHLLCHEPLEAAKMVRQLEAIEGVGGVEVGVDGEASQDLAIALVRAAAGELPVIARLPFERALELATSTIQAGALAVSLAPPRGSLPAPGGEIVQGRLYGPAIFPAALRVVHELVRQGIPTIGAGGVYTQELCTAMLRAGALAVQLDTVLWLGLGYRIFT
jgi:dihydroorotate dehydrogenase (NAD+) catalytic subunit